MLAPAPRPSLCSPTCPRLCDGAMVLCLTSGAASLLRSCAVPPQIIAVTVKVSSGDAAPVHAACELLRLALAHGSWPPLLFYPTDNYTHSLCLPPFLAPLSLPSSLSLSLPPPLTRAHSITCG